MRAVRVGAWLLFALLGAVYLTFAALPGPRAAAAAQWALALAILPAPLASLGALARSQGYERRYWGALVWAGTFVLASQVYWAWSVTFVDAAGPVPFSLANLFDLCAAAAFVALLTFMLYGRITSPLERYRRIVDFVGMGIASFALLMQFAIRPWFAAAGIGDTAAALGAGYTVVGAIVFAGTTAMFLARPSGRRWESWEKLLAWGFGTFAAGIAAWPLWYASAARGRGWVAAAVELTWFGGLYLLSMAAVHRLTDPEARWRISPLPVVGTVRAPAAEFVVVGLNLVCIGVFGYGSFTSHAVQGRLLFGAAAGALMALTATRAVLTAAEAGVLGDRSARDELTGLGNHRFFQERLALEIERAARYREELSVVVIDVDDFARVNASRGHDAGDETLIAVSRAFGTLCRPTDVLCRVGGDEFGVLMLDTSEDEAVAVASRMVAAARRCGQRGSVLTVSAGVASYPRDGVTREALHHGAEGARYWAWLTGRDRVVAFDRTVIETADDVERVRSAEERSRMSVIRALAAVVDARDAETQAHSGNVAVLARMLAEAAGLPEERQRLIEMAGLVHDVGKVGVPDAILRKKGPLGPGERESVHQHPLLGERILSSVGSPEMLPWVRGHHERWDGAGYPDGLAGEAIPLEARILAVCDAFDAMTSDRPYRGALSRGAALQEIDVNLGAQFDPALGDLFIRKVATLDADAAGAGS